MLEPIKQALTELGIPVALVTAVVIPTIACTLIVFLRYGFLRLIERRIRRPRRRRRWRLITFYGAVGLGLAVFQGLWLASVRQIAAWIAGVFSLNEQTVNEKLVTGLSAVLATAVLVLTIVGLRAIHHLVVVRLRAWSLRTHAIRIQKLELVKTSRLRRLIGYTLKVEAALLVLCGVVLYGFYILSIFPVTAQIGKTALERVAAIASNAATAIINYLPNFVYLLIVWSLAIYSIKAIKFLLRAVGRKDLRIPNFDPEWADPTYKLARALLIAFAIVISYPFLPGAQSAVFKGFSVFLGALLTLGSTAVVGNVISGVVLTYTGAFHLGDRVKIGDTTGDILAKTLFVTRLRTVENEIVSIPNGVVLTGSVTNYARMARRAGLIIRIRVGIGYDVAWERVHQLLEEAAASTKHIVEYPPPVVWEISLDDYAVTYELRAATDQPNGFGAIRAALHRSVLDAFSRAGIEIMTPSVQSVRDGSTPALPPQTGARSAAGSQQSVVDTPREGRRHTRNSTTTSVASKNPTS